MTFEFLIYEVWYFIFLYIYIIIYRQIEFNMIFCEVPFRISVIFLNSRSGL